MAPFKRRGAFVVIEGLDGAGKTSNIRNLGNYFSHSDTPHFMASEYDDSKVCLALRTMLNNQAPDFNVMTETMMFYASRIEHTQKIIAPYLDGGTHVITDRYYATTLAYQGVKNPKVREVHGLAQPHLREPDLILFYDIPGDVYEARVLMRGKGLDAIESRGRPYFEQVRANFLKLAENDPRYLIIDATKPLEDVFTETIARVDAFLRTFNEDVVAS